MSLDESLPVAFLPQNAHGLPGRLGFAPARSSPNGCS